jgi:glycosyltransferase involved in cell wall biosynthesis
MSRNSDTLVSVLVVLKDDYDLIDEFIGETTEIMTRHFQFYEMLLVDNGSTDNTSRRIQEIQRLVPNLRLIRLSRTYDNETALAAALENSLGDYVVCLDIETDPPSLIPTMIDHALSGYEVVIAERQDKDEHNIIHRFLKVAFFRIASKMLGYQMQPNASYFRVMSRQVVNSISRFGNKNRYLRYLNAIVGFSQDHVPYRRVYRAGNRTRRSLIKSVLSAVDLVISNSAVPLRFASLLGVLASFSSLIYVFYILIVSLIKKSVAEGWITTNLMTTAMFFTLFLMLSVLSEYVARILEETKNRPLYFIEYETNSSVSFHKELKESNRVNVV